MGGVETDIRGATSLEGLFAAGECAGAGVHGANRMASNSLLEATVFGRRAGQAARDDDAPRTSPRGEAPPADLPPPDLTRLRTLMSRDAGVVRDAAGLTRLIDGLDRMDAVHGQALPLQAARLVAEAALARRESRGAHFRSDFPAAAAPALHTLREQPSAPRPRRAA
jgi:L-aspartate oxidase